MTTPKISIIIPVYNAEKYILTCLDSLLKQKEKRIEIILVDDGSRDNSWKIMQKLSNQDKRIKIFHISNAGPGAARQHGLDHASGEFIMFCDADDKYQPEMCSKMLKKIEQYGVDWGCCDYKQIGGQSRTKELSQSLYQQYFALNIPSLGMGLWCYIFRKKIIDHFQIKFPNSFYGEDAAFINKYLYVCHSYFTLAEKLYIHIISEDSLMQTITQTQGLKKFKNSLMAQFDIYDFLLHHHLFETYEKHYFSELEKMLILISSLLSDTDIVSLFSQVSDFIKNKNITPNFEILSAAKKHKLKAFIAYLRTTNTQRTRRISFGNITIFKISNGLDKKAVRFLGFPIYKKTF